MERPAFSDGRAGHGQAGSAIEGGSGRRNWDCCSRSVPGEDGGGGLRRLAHVAMVQTADFRD
jgi:hypothetical protein